MRIKFGEIEITQAARDHINDCLNNNHVTMGPKTKSLEQKWSRMFNYKHTIAVSSGTSACMAANMALYDFGAQPNDEVIVPALSFIASANAIRAAGFKPVFVDVKHDLLINEELIEQAITPRTRAIMAVALMGKPPKMDVIDKLATKHNLKVILDNCEGHGCKYQGKYMGEWADIVVYSCYAAHILFSVEMGLVGTNCDVVANAVESIRSHGRKPNSLYFDHLRFGLNLKPTDLNASVGLGSIEQFDEIFERRRRNWTFIKACLSDYQDLLWMSDEDEGSTTSPHGFSLTIKPNTKITLQGLTKALDEAEIDWKRNFGSMPTQHACFSYLQYRLGDFPNAEHIGNNGIHIGVHQFLIQEDLDKIVKTIKNYIDNI